MVDSADEQNLIKASQKGDHEAFEMLVRQHQRMIHSLAFRMTGSLAEAEDLAQETFIQAYRELPGFKGTAKLSSWLYRIALNRCLNWRKKAARRREFHTSYPPEPATLQPDADALSEQVHAALLKLSSGQRAAVVLTIYDGLSHAKAARVLGCSETTISWRLFVARSKLKKLLGTIRTEIRP